MASRLPVKQTRETVLQFVSEEQIFEYYLGDSIDLTRKYCSPLRTDNNPTCTFKVMQSGRLWFRDWAGHFSGDCFNLVEEFYQCDFKEALLYIDRDLNLNLFDNSAEMQRQIIIDENKSVDRTVKQRAIIDVRRQPYEVHDLEYWASQGVVGEYLTEYNVFVAKFVRINGYQIWEYTPEDPIYVYLLASGAIKCYRPLAKDRQDKWLSNTSVDDIFGWEQLPETGHICLITKSLKDIMALRYLGYTSCAIQAEGNDFPEDKMEDLKKRFTHVIYFYDNDEAGMTKMAQESERFNVPYTYIPQFIEGKDISGLINHHGARYAKSILEINLEKYL